jgi:hypothetical protein
MRPMPSDALYPGRKIRDQYRVTCSIREERYATYAELRALSGEKDARPTPSYVLCHGAASTIRPERRPYYTPSYVLYPGTPPWHYRLTSHVLDPRIFHAHGRPSHALCLESLIPCVSGVFCQCLLVPRSVH